VNEEAIARYWAAEPETTTTIIIIIINNNINNPYCDDVCVAVVLALIR
jgi:hypothetical protein